MKRDQLKSKVKPDAQVTIDGSRCYQSIDNFGASDAWSMEPIGKDWSEENKARIADLLFSRDRGLGYPRGVST